MMPRKLRPPTLVASLLASLVASDAVAQKLAWPGFRGPARDGVANAASNPPLKWSDTENVLWKASLPGPGASSPVIVGDRVLVTCYTGYGADRAEPGEFDSLKHHILCFDTAGKKLWQHDVDGGRKAKARQVQINEHGFASPTPVTDGKTIYVYFGKVGVVATDMDGKRLWIADLGKMPERPEGAPPPTPRPDGPDGKPLPLRWGAASSPLIHGDLIIVNASEESDSIRAVNRHTGKTAWVRPSPKLEGSSISPMIAGEGDAAVLVIALASEVWGLEPQSGKTVWSVDTGTTTGMCPTPVADERLVYTFGGSGESHALRFERSLDENAKRIVWTSKQNLGIPSPTLHDGLLFLCQSRGTASCLSADTGEVVFRGRLPGRTGTLYASPTLVGNRLYVTSRTKGTFVYSTDGKFELLAHNQLESDTSRFDGSPAVVGDRLYLRSDRQLYCIASDSGQE